MTIRRRHAEQAPRRGPLVDVDLADVARSRALRHQTPVETALTFA
jgi:hypothetical protein